MSKDKRTTETFRGNNRDMPVAFERDRIILWAHHHGWTEIKKDDAIVLANAILEKYGEPK